MTFATTEPGGDRIVVEGTVPASPERVFRAWTDPEEIKKWFGGQPGALESASVDLRPGGRWCFIETTSAAGSVGFQGRYLEIKQDEELVFSWSKFTDDTAGMRTATPPSRVEVRLSATPEGTRITVVHSAIDNAQLRADFALGWKRAMPNLSVAI